ncbi:hypothetical protein [Actinokineospora inagensis]|uniref:hypothetical protein n=1 Tax=Actinokineospora inagensis TaxID=103730 RepID=UPI00040979FC|nr:hypothetical protein [Actinokineospora inagensis]
MSSLRELDEALRALRGARWTDVDRTVNMAEVGFQLGDVEFRLHVQCPFRIVHREKVLLGSVDMRYPQRRSDDPGEAFDERVTMYDRNARKLTDRLTTTDTVSDTSLEPDGAFTITVADDIRIQAFPASAGPVEAWRLFERGADIHYVHPDSADQD